MEEKIIKEQKKLFDEIKSIDENGVEFWSARDLQERLGYQTWDKFEGTIERAKESFISSGIRIDMILYGRRYAVPVVSSSHTALC